MRTIKIGEKEYTLEFTFRAAEHQNLVQSMFNVLSGAYIVKNGTGSADEKDATIALLNGVSEMVADVSRIVKIAFYAGLMEHHQVTEDEAYDLMKQYMTENKISFKKLFDDIKTYMEEDGFFDLSGLTEAIQEMNQTADNLAKPPKKPQDHKTKSTSTK